MSSENAAALPPALAGINDPTEKARVQGLIEGARREGGLSWIGVQLEAAGAESIFAEFKRHYGLDDVRVEYSYTPTGKIVTQIEQLLRTGKNDVDIVWSSSWAWYKDLLVRGEIMRYESPNYQEYELSDRNGMSEPGYWVSDAYSFSPVYNPAAVERLGIKDFNPTSWADFVDPRLAGNISMIDVFVSASAAPVLAGVAKVMGDDWLERLGTIKPTLHGRGADCREEVAAGERAVSLFSAPADARLLAENGVEVKQVFPEEGVVLIPFTPIILQRAPHPNIAQLFIDFVRSEEATQDAVAEKAEALLFFGRRGIKTKHPDLVPTAEEVKVIPFDWDTEGTDEAIEAFRAKARAAGIGSE